MFWGHTSHLLGSSLASVALWVSAACSSDEASPIGTAEPSPLSGGAPAAPLSGETPATPSSAPGGTPDRDPCATETNFITLVCATDADCAPVGYCEPWPAADAGEQQLTPELAAATGPAGAAPACVEPGASELAASSGPAEAASAAPVQLAAPAEGAEQADAGAWRPLGRCIPY